MSAESSRSIFLRLPADLRQWVAEEGLRGRRSMNAVIVDAIGQSKAIRTERMAEDNHAAAIELAISVAQLAKGTAIMLQTEHHHLRTGILVRKPSQADYSVLACVRGEDVAFVDDFVAPVVELGP